MQKTSLIAISLLALLACSAFAAVASAQESIDGATPDPSMAPEPTKDANDGNASSRNATLPPDDQQVNILDDNASAPLIAPGPQSENGEELMYTSGLAEDRSNNTIAIVGIIVAAVAVAGATIGLVHRRRQTRKA